MTNQKSNVGSGRAGVSKTPRKRNIIDQPRQIGRRLAQNASTSRTIHPDNVRSTTETASSSNVLQPGSVPNSRESICRNEQIQILGNFFESQDGATGGTIATNMSVPTGKTKKVTKIANTNPPKEIEPGRVVNPRTGFSYRPGTRWSTRIKNPPKK